MNRDEEVAYNRTFLLFDTKKDLCKTGCHGTTGTGRKITVDDYLAVLKEDPPRSVALVDHRTDLTKRRWEQPNYHFQYDAYQLTSQSVREIKIVPKITQDFTAHASAWEVEWSVLVKKASWRFQPLVDANCTVIGHVGIVSERHVLVPEDTPREPTYVETLLSEYPNVPVLISDSREAKVPEGWRQFRDGKSWYRLTVVTGIDGEVIVVADSEATNGVAIPTDGPMDYISLGRIGGKLISSIGLRVLKGLGRSLSRLGGRLLAKALAARNSKNLFSKLKFVFGHRPEMGIPPTHFQAILEAAKETDCILIFRANKAAAVPLIEKGAPGKPLFFKFKSDPQTGILTATERAHFDVVYQNGYYTALPNNMAQRLVKKGGKDTLEVIPLKAPFWPVKPGQVIHPTLHKPVVGDYDMLGAVPMKSKGSNVALVPKEPANGDWSGPVVEKAAKAVNKRLDMDRVLHGAQDQHNKMGLSEGPAYAVYPDGSVHLMADKAAQEAFYKHLGRQTGAGMYPRPTGHVVDELAARRGAR